LLKIAAGNDEALEAYLHILKYKILCAENDNLKCFEQNFRQVNELVNNMRGQNGFDNVCKIQQRVIDLNPNLAQELCFLEIRQLSMKVKTVQKLENIQDDEILTIYSQDFLVQINLWSNLAVSASVKHQGPIRDALV
jgi:hypothetical protein